MLIIKSIVKRIALSFILIYIFFHDHQFSYFHQFHFPSNSIFLLFFISPSSIFVFDRLIAVWQTMRETANCPEAISGGVTASPPETKCAEMRVGDSKGWQYVEWGRIDFFLVSAGSLSRISVHLSRDGAKLPLTRLFQSSLLLLYT